MALAATASRVDIDGYLTAEILPKPDPDSAAQQAIRFLRDRLAARPAVPA
jgi:hypothetical protein